MKKAGKKKRVSEGNKDEINEITPNVGFIHEYKEIKIKRNYALGK